MDNPNKRQGHISQATVFMAPIVAFFLFANAAHAEPPQSAPTAGEEYEIIKSYETSSQGSDGSSGNSSGHDGILERVVAVHDGGLELEYDLPKEATAEERARSWQFPARVFRSAKGAVELRNRPEVEARVDGWLKAGGFTRADCGRWIFTWNAFQIECDPQTVIETVEAFDLRSADIREGASYQDIDAAAPGTLKKTDGPDGATLTAVMEIDPDAVRRARADSDVVVGELMQTPVRLDAALREHANESISGTISVTFETDSAGNIRKKTKVTKMEIKGGDGKTESRTATETVERRLVSAGSTVR